MANIFKINDDKLKKAASSAGLVQDKAAKTEEKKTAAADAWKVSAPIEKKSAKNGAQRTIPQSASLTAPFTQGSQNGGDWRRSTAAAASSPQAAFGSPTYSLGFESSKNSDDYINANSPFAGYRITSKTGQRSTGISGASKNHAGIDRAMAVGTAVSLPIDVTFYKAGYSNARGNWIEFKDSAGNILHYQHLQSYNTFKPGQAVPAGTVLAKSGNTGVGSGAHLHEEYYSPSGINITESYWNKYAAKDASGAAALGYSAAQGAGTGNIFNVGTNSVARSGWGVFAEKEKELTPFERYMQLKNNYGEERRKREARTAVGKGIWNKRETAASEQLKEEREAQKRLNALGVQAAEDTRPFYLRAIDDAANEYYDKLDDKQREKQGKYYSQLQEKSEKYKSIEENADFSAVSDEDYKAAATALREYDISSSPTLNAGLISLLKKGSQSETKNKMINALEEGAISNTIAYSKYIDSGEFALYAYILKTQGEAAAKEYLEYIKDDVLKRYDEKEFAPLVKKTEELSRKSWLAAQGINAAAGAAAIPAYAKTTARGLSNLYGKEYKPMNEYDPVFSGVRIQNAAAEGRLTDEEGNARKGVLRNLFEQASLGVSQSLGSALIGGGLGVYIMAGSAAGQAAYDAAQEGIDPAAAAANATVQGALEYITEKLPFDTMMKAFHSPKGAVSELLAEIAKAGGAEFGEEAVNNILGNAAEQIILGDKSAFSKRAKEYTEAALAQNGNNLKNQDKIAKEAAKQAFFDIYVKDTLYSGVVGALSGAAQTGAAGIAGDAVKTARIYRRAGFEEAINKLGYKIEYTDDASIDGMVDKDAKTLFINGTSKNPWRIIAKHEITHMLEESGKYGEFISILKNDMPAAWKAAEDRVRILYERVNRAREARGEEAFTLDADTLEAETAAELGEALKTERFIRNFAAGENMPFTMRAIEFARDMAQNAQNKLGTDNGWRKAAGLWAEALNGVRSDAAGSGKRYYTHVDNNGNKITVITDNQGLFAGVDAKEASKTAAKLLTERYKNKVIPLSDYGLIHIRKTGINKYLHSTNADENAHLNKLKAAGEFENLLLNAEYLKSTSDKKNHSFAKYGFDHYKTVFAIDGQVFEGIIDVGISEKGAEFYGMTNVKRVTGIRDGNYSDPLSVYKSAFSGNSSDNSIAQNAPAVNNNIRKSNENDTHDGSVRYKLVGETADGIEVYETSDEIKNLSYKERKKKFLALMKNEYRGRTARFIKNGEVYYARFEDTDVRKNIYGDKKSDVEGYDAKIKMGAEGDIFNLVENSRYDYSLQESGKTTSSHKNINEWDYFVKTVQIDGELYDVVSNVRKKLDGEFVYDIKLNQSKKRKNSPYSSPVSEKQRMKLGQEFSFNNSIAQNAPAVNNNIRKSNENDTHDGSVRYKIAYTEDNKPVAIIEKDILYGVEDKDIIKTVKNELKKFSDGIPVHNSLIKVNRRTGREFTGSKYTDNTRRKDNQIYKDKMRSAANIDEVITASVNYVNEDTSHARKDNFVQFARGNVLLRIGNNDYSAKVIVGITDKNNTELYDIVSFKPSKFSLKNRPTQIPLNAAEAGQSVNNRIAQNAPTVNSNIRKSNKNDTHDGGVRYKLVGETADGIEVYETSDEVKALTYKERMAKFIDIMENEFRGRTAKFENNGNVYYARFLSRDLKKNIYGDKKSDQKGRNAKIRAGADGDIFDLAENAQYFGSKTESGKKTNAHKGVIDWDYFVKTVQIDNHVYDVIANVRKRADGEFVYSLQMNENKKIKAAPSLDPNKNGVLKSDAHRFSNRIAQNAPTVNNNIRKSNKNDTHDGGVRYKIAYTEDNKPVAIIEKDILYGVEDKDIIKTVKNELKKFSDGIPVHNSLIKVNRRTGKEFTYSKNTKSLWKSGKGIYNDKMRASANMDDVVKASTNYINEDVKHQRKDNFVQFARGNVLLRIGMNDYSANVIIGINDKNGTELYDIVDFTPTQFNLKQKTDRKQLIIDEKSNATDVGQSFNNNISQDDTVVNNNIRKSNKNDTQQRRKLAEPDEILNRYGIKNINDYIEVQRKVQSFLSESGFYSDEGGKSRTVTNNDSGMVIEINNSGIKETFGNGKRFHRLGKNLKLAKLWAIEYLPQIIQNGRLAADNVSNYHGNASSVKFAYIEGFANNGESPVSVKITIKKSPQKNKFWLHQVDLQKKSQGLPAGVKNSKTGYNGALDENSIAQENDNVKGVRRKIAVPDLETGEKTSRVYGNTIQKDFSSKESKAEASARRQEFIYKGISNEKTYAAASERADAMGLDEAYADFMQKDRFSAFDVATGLKLFTEYQAKGDIDKAVDVMAKMRPQMTAMGQATQAMALADRLTPEGKIMLFVKEAQRTNQSKIKEKIGKFSEKKRAEFETELARAAKADQSRKARRANAAVQQDVKAEDKSGSEAFKDLVEKYKTAAERVYDKYGIKYIPESVIKYAAKALEDIRSIDSKEKLIRLILDTTEKQNVRLGRLDVKMLKNQRIEFLRESAAASVMQTAQDYIPSSLGEKISNIQLLAQLTNSVTFMRNIAGNAAFSALDKLGNNVGVLADMALAKATGRRTVGVETPAFIPGKKAKAQRRQGLGRAERSYIKTTLATGGGEGGKYMPQKQVWNGGSRVARVMNEWNRALGHMLTDTDEFFKGMAEESVRQSLTAYADSLAKMGMSDAAIAEELDNMMKYRTFQDDNRVSKLTSGMKKALNRLGFADHSFGLGDLVIKYPKIPANIVMRSIEYSPAGYAKVILCAGKIMADGGLKNMPPKEQRALALTLGRATAGTGLMLTAAALASVGAITSPDDDDERERLEREGGSYGLELNLSAISRLIKSGGESGEKLRDGDVLVQLTGLEPVSQIIRQGAAISKDGLLENIAAMASAMGESVSDLAVMQTFSNITDTYRYTGDWGAVALGAAGDAVTGFIPSMLKRIASFADTSMRDIYHAGSVGKELEYQIKNAVPGLRNTLSASISSLGEARTNSSGSRAVDFINSFLSPAKAAVYHEPTVASELKRLAAASDEKLSVKPPSSFQSSGETYKPVGKDYEEWAKMSGGRTMQYLSELFGSEEYKMSNDYVKAIMAKEAKQQAVSDAKAAFADYAKGAAPSYKGSFTNEFFGAEIRGNNAPAEVYKADGMSAGKGYVKFDRGDETYILQGDEYNSFEKSRYQEYERLYEQAVSGKIILQNPYSARTAADNKRRIAQNKKMGSYLKKLYEQGAITQAQKAAIYNQYASGKAVAVSGVEHIAPISVKRQKDYSELTPQQQKAYREKAYDGYKSGRTTREQYSRAMQIVYAKSGIVEVNEYITGDFSELDNEEKKKVIAKLNSLAAEKATQQWLEGTK